MRLEDIDIDDISQEEFDKAVAAEKKHRALINAMAGNSEALAKTVDTFLNKLKEISSVKIPTPQVNVNTDNAEIIKISNEIKQLFTEIKDLLTEKKEWDFTVITDRNNRLTGVKAIQTNSKPLK